ncbi:glycoside hydrolase family 35 protein [Sphingomonas sp.]|uniref:glycoside hydrolase family 35 protein n=1 Tax=Sphingomonas sp. TaxID=28214 RepID=UPI002ED917FE
MRVDRRSFIAGAGALSAAGATAAPRQRFAIEGDAFLLDGQPFQIRAAEMHYPRIPRACWRDRMKKARSLGLNTLSAYCFWSVHEPRPGRYDFTGQNDVAAFLRIAQEEGLYVALRPGPYICGEWDAGGYPAWLFADPALRVRTLDPRYMAATTAWLKRLGQELAPLQITRGGPVILVQVENEYGSFGQDAAYMTAMRDLVRAAGFEVPLYTADGAAVVEKGMVPGAVAAIDFASTDNAIGEFARLAKARPGAPRYASEVWSGWFDHWGEPHQVVPAEPLARNIDAMMKAGSSFSFYMFHGGTSFAFDAGANLDPAKGYQPDITSYDYDALLDEAGRPTAKYAAVRDVLLRHGVTGPALPAPQAGITIPRFSLSQTAPLAQLHKPPLHHDRPQPMEVMEQSHGLMLYRHRATRDLSGVLRFEPHDHAVVSIAGRRVGTLDRRLKQTDLAITVRRGETIDLLISAFGRINYGPLTGRDRKGIDGMVLLGGVPLTGWDHQPLPLDDVSELTFGDAALNGPAFYRGTVDLAATGYTFLDMRGWGMGYAWVNGHNLGRYWSIGPQRHLYVPAEWLRPGANSVVVLDLEGGGARTLAAGTSPIWDAPRPG